VVASEKTFEIEIGGSTIRVDWPIRSASSTRNLVLVVLDPDHYLADRAYREARRSGSPAIRNLQAFSKDSGEKIWEAELPEPVDYYYELANIDPIEALSYSGYRCVIAAADGRIKSKQFFK
jgi:hypothetical protein